MAFGIQMKRLGERLKEAGEEVAAPGTSIPKLEEQKWSQGVHAQ